MLLVGLTGGIGSGKSTVATMLERRGAVVIDADDLAREAVAAGTPGHAAVIRTFGPEAVGPDGELDRGWLAGHVFSDPEARRALEAIVHPEVARLLAERVAPYRSGGRIVVYSVPLLVEAGLRSAFDVVVTVSAAEDVRVARLAGDRRMTPEQARARIAAQVGDEERERAADVVIRNDGSIQDLERRVEEVCQELRRWAGTRSGS